MRPIFLEFTNDDTSAKIMINLADISTIEEIVDGDCTAITLKNNVTIIARENYSKTSEFLRTLQQS